MRDQFLECNMLRYLGIGLVTALIFLSVTSAGPDAAQLSVTQVDRNADGTMIYHFLIKVGQTDTMEPGTGDALPADFVTIYNFYGLVDGSVKTPNGWKFTSEESGRTPGMGGYPLVLPMDIPGTPNITWTVTAVVKPGTEVTGFSAVTRVTTMTDGMYSALVTQRSGPIQGAAGSPGSATMTSKQAQIGMIATPSFLADLKK
jgi:hypothetical protein